MRRTLIGATAAVLLVTPAIALAGAGAGAAPGDDLTTSPVPGDDAPAATPAQSTTHALHAQGLSGRQTHSPRRAAQAASASEGQARPRPAGS